MRDLALRYTRLQSWFPFTMHVGLNGREWLVRQMIKAGLRYRKKENCFTGVFGGPGGGTTAAR